MILLNFVQFHILLTNLIFLSPFLRRWLKDGLIYFNTSLPLHCWCFTTTDKATRKSFQRRKSYSLPNQLSFGEHSSENSHRMHKIEERLNTILRKAQNSSEISDIHFCKLDVTNKLATFAFLNLNQCKVKFCILVLVLAHFLYNSDAFNSSDECILEMPPDASKIFREPESCDICNKVDQIDKVGNISALDFYEKYARAAKPLVVNDGAVSWRALKAFDFDFFKNLYKSVDIKKNSRTNCQFFPYKTEFKSLEEVFEMTTERSKLAPGEKSWYIGWNNCNDEAGKVLQQYYKKPYFLSNNSENIAMSWIFMGGPGHGAHMHVDNVHYPSWQAQLKGKKLWKLAPPPECLYKCKTLDIVVEPGEIIVVDTNRWYHQTFILPGEISITIGSEFD